MTVLFDAPKTLEEVKSNTEQQIAPYAEALARHAAADPIQVMVPGHSGSGKDMSARLSNFLGERAVNLDLPLMLTGIDLGDDSPLMLAQKLAAEAWGAKRTWFMTNGASQANRTAAVAARGIGERVLIQRSSHSSFGDGVLFTGLIPRFIKPSIDEHHGIAHGLTPSAVAAALQQAVEEDRPVSSVYIVSPSYFGSVSDVARIADVAHRYDAALIVDGAWGAHFGFHEDLPESPLRLGADLAISSTHKLAGSLTQSAMLHLGYGPYADRLEDLIRRGINMTSSTSASALLMASLDVSRQALVAETDLIGESVENARMFRALIKSDDRFSLIDETFANYRDIVGNDLLRIAIDVSKLGQSGHWVRDRLIEDHRVFFEMATATTIVAVFGAGQLPPIDKIFAAMQAVADEALSLEAATIVFPKLPEPGDLRTLPRDAFFGETEVVDAVEAVGRISADSLAAYPPGIPNLLPGEEITEETVAFLQAVANSPTGYVRGAVDSKLTQFRVRRMYG
ncbi:MAG TPA: amino acid decarboxylase [Microbacteriaceae bacterium]|nr:amino acid decarboxylase [Microbacteriaceae bacterium]